MKTQTSTKQDDQAQREAFRQSLTRLDVDLSPYAFEIAYARLTTMGKRPGEVSDAQIRSIVDDVISSTEILQGVAESFR